MHEELDFVPFPFLNSPHSQTIVNGFIYIPPEPPSIERIIHLPDGDRLSIQITTPQKWKRGDLTVILIHGLCGSHRSPNLARMADKLLKKNVRSIRVNMRGSGTGKGLARKMAHGGRSEDLFECVRVIKNEESGTPFYIIGFSLGGNVVLKLAGELGSLGKRYVEGIVAISPPVDFFACVKNLDSPGNQLYQRYFFKRMRTEAIDRHKKFKELPRISIPSKVSSYDFDRLYTAPHNHFKSVEEYYARCSSVHMVPHIEVPCRILFSEDDPIICPTSLDDALLPSNVRLFKTKKGGHLGYIGDLTMGFFWLDTILIDWIWEDCRNVLP